ncbi:pantoate--beta-alanine ligase [Alkalihalobacillus sp. LMS6]|uniref:pantoate--beta-alanine ligase n=1 Tax=Alkalihalobacillus sp. LMS6 TaxID=2924034 RepID=UPI0020D1BF90|nr:pantoate--beta-alanine ligase [Alkalihalobacillus sp. LMS6]UTR08361.1 pantoate--beta-alanine ligase [Alkalihalobacillus sp. LMS6]
MIVVKTKQELQQALKPFHLPTHSIGFVPTMGALHEGHVSLMEAANANHSIVVVSIFVNPLQFGPNEDFETYPRQLEADQKVAREAGCDILFCPSVEDIYPDGFPQIVHVQQGANVMCGKSRPGHFDGVATVVLKLFSLIRPEAAYFGKKDAQQLAIIKQLVNEFFMPIKVVGCKTVREEDGLARSSRNVHLTKAERQYAPLLYKALQRAKASNNRNVPELIELVRVSLAQIPSGSIDYIEAYEYPSLKQVEVATGRIILALAYQFSHARLIDHVQIDFSNRGEA